MPSTSLHRRTGRVAGLLVALLLVGLWAVAPAVTAAQVQIDQVESTTQQVEGASQSQIFVATGAEVDRGSVLELIPGAAPADADGNSAAVFQEGNRNNVSIRQAGLNNEASATQIGDGNAIAITQDGAGPDAVPAAFENGLPASGEGFATIQGIAPVGSGTGNLAVAMHDGSNNQTGILQRGADNVAGIRLDGSDNTMNLVQAGNENQFLMDAEVSNREMSVVQNGNSNVLDTTLPINAEMNGNGIEMVIRRTAPPR